VKSTYAGFSGTRREPPQASGQVVGGEVPTAAVAGQQPREAQPVGGTGHGLVSLEAEC
jgi:hypothetical protein